MATTPDVRPRSPMGGTAVMLLRLAIAALVAALGIVLWADGHELVGGLLVALAGVRVALFLTMAHRRRQWQAQRPRRSQSRPEDLSGWAGRVDHPGRRLDP